MATFDDKILGEKLHYYCSSSEDEGEDGDKAGGGGGESGAAAQPPPVGPGSGGTCNTGPKGVIEDWQRYKQLEVERREENEAERIALAKKLSLSARTDKEDQEAKEREQKAADEFDNLFGEDDEFLRDYMKQRMEEMLEKNMCTKRNYGKIVELRSDSEFLDAVDKVDKNVIVVIFVTEDDAPGCAAVQGCLVNIAKDYDHIKFCKMYTSTVGLSKRFKDKGVPAILAYKGGDQIISLIRITDKLGEDFFADDLEGFLVDHGVLHDRKLLPTVIRGPAKHADHGSSDEEGT